MSELVAAYGAITFISVDRCLRGMEYPIGPMHARDVIKTFPTCRSMVVTRQRRGKLQTRTRVSLRTFSCFEPVPHTPELHLLAGLLTVLERQLSPRAHSEAIIAVHAHSWKGSQLSLKAK